MSPIYEECATAAELKGLQTYKDIGLRSNHYFCQNDFANMFRFFDGKVVECAMEKKNVIFNCIHAHMTRSLYRGKINKLHPLFGTMIDADELCK